jgi:hypothetical protein
MYIRGETNWCRLVGTKNTRALPSTPATLWLASIRQFILSFSRMHESTDRFIRVLYLLLVTFILPLHSSFPTPIRCWHHMLGCQYRQWPGPLSSVVSWDLVFEVPIAYHFTCRFVVRSPFFVLLFDSKKSMANHFMCRSFIRAHHLIHEMVAITYHFL